MEETEQIPRLMRSPRKVEVDITSQCDLNCVYCYYQENPAIKNSDLTVEEWLRFFDELGSLGLMKVSLAGGEPFMREDLPELLEGIVRNRMRYDILTNGTLINDRMAEFIAKTNRCDMIHLSLDGSCSQVNDIIRGEGSFEKAVVGIRALLKHKVPVCIRATITRHNLKDLEALARFVLEDLGVAVFSSNSVDYLGFGRLNYKELSLTAEDRSNAIKILQALDRKYPGRIWAAAGPLAEARIWSRMEEARRKDDPIWPNGGRLTGCGCLFNNINVRADGVITPCMLLSRIELGRVNRDSFQEVWRNSPKLNRLRARGEKKLEGFEFCRGCEYVKYCNGGCPVQALAVTGQVNHPSPNACLRRFMADGGCLELSMKGAG